MKANRLDIILATAFNNKENSAIYKPIKYVSIKKLLSTDYSQAYDAYQYNGVLLYRGDDDHHNDKIMLAKSGNRVSKGNANIYTKLISDCLPAWSKYPKRNKSFICSLDSEVAEAYGNVLAVLPKNNTSIGICPTLDMWDSFSRLNNLIDDVKCGSTCLNVLDHAIADIYSSVNDNNDKTMPSFVNENKEDVIKFFNEFDEKIKSHDKAASNYSELSDLILRNAWDGNSTYDLLAELLDPNDNHFELKDNISEIKNSNLSNEVWFSGECIIIDPNYLR